MSNLRLYLRRSLTGEFSPLLQGGVLLEVPAGTSVHGLLTGVLGLSPEYVQERVCTVFLDGKPVDNLRTSAVTERSVLALSAAMPGLVGGTMRCGSPLAAMRSTVSHHPGGVKGRGGNVTVKVKLFNLLMEELGLPLLERGVLVPASPLAAFLSRRTPSFWARCREATLDGSPLCPSSSAPAGLEGVAGAVMLTVRFEEGE